MTNTVAITGAGGFVGKALCQYLIKNEYQILKLIRNSPGSNDEIQWDPDAGCADYKKLENCKAFIHLAGESIFSLRWNEKKKQKIKNSRILGTRNIISDLLKLQQPPEVFICASAIGFYGDRKDEILTENSAKGMGFLADTAELWEKESAILVKNNIRVVNLRLGIILGSQGGALKKMLLPFRLGLGGPLGNGKQYMSWIALEDVVSIIKRSIEDNISGSVNVTSPNPITNEMFTKTLAKKLHKPAFFRIPAPILKLVLGEMAEELLLSSQRVIPEKLTGAGYKFVFDKLEDIKF